MSHSSAGQAALVPLIYYAWQGNLAARFDLGKTLISSNAAAALAEHGLAADAFFARHAVGDWGEAEEFDCKGNAFALEHGITRFPIQSCYRLPGDRLLLLLTTPDRSQTGMILDSEFADRDVSTQKGYAYWAHQYDQEVNPLIAIETPYVEQILATLPIDHALDAATGTGRHALWLAKRGIQVTGFDQSPEMLAEAQAAATRNRLPIDFQPGSLEERLPFIDAQFDLVICALALCHVEQLQAAISEFARVLKPGGTLLISDFHPYCVGQGWRAALFEPACALVFSYPSHTRDDYLGAITDAGLHISQVIDATMGEAPVGSMLDEEREGGRDIPFCLIILAHNPVKG
jgi:SAM-dependent methyltransferase